MATRSSRSAAPVPASGAVSEIDTAECWRLAEKADVGRFVVADAGGLPEVFPVNHLVHEGSIYLRTAPGRKLRVIAAQPLAAFEVDGVDGALRWSVVIKGTAVLVESEEEIRASGIIDLASAHPSAKPHIIRLTPQTITGRRFPASDASADDARRTGAPGAAPVVDNGLRKPTPIPHFPPALPA
ncbi:hypothetical protein MHM582_2241 [Microbacterium sp. HM58-2]|nr:hypothetical protein MHM582_2241 [Microbacterium sp. HM58-2]